MQPIKSINAFLTGLVLSALFTACSKREEPVAEVAPVETERELSQAEKYEAEFKRLVVSSNMTVRATEMSVNKLCREIDRLPDKQEALRLFDRLGELAIEQQVTETNLYFRQNWFQQLWYVTLDAFGFAQLHRQESFKDWDRLFRFFKKYTDEISEVEAKYAKTKGSKEYVYLRGIKGDLLLAIHVMRDFGFPHMTQGLTEEQKADILRRFDELQKYTAEPPDCIGRKIEAK